MNCSHCGSFDLRNRPRRNAFYPLAYAAVLGLPLAQFHQASAPREYDCRGCGRALCKRTTLGRFAFVFFIVGGVWYALAILASLLWLMLR